MQNDAIDGFREFLAYGPIGLAGLMLILVVFALTLGTLTEARERTLRLFMFVGAFCFVAVLAAQFFSKASEHEVQLLVAPNDLGETSPFPPPIISVNGQRIDRGNPVIVTSRTTVLVDVTDALGIYKAAATRVEEQAVAIAEAERVTTELQAAIASQPSSGPTIIEPAVQFDLRNTNRMLRKLIP